MKKKMLLVLMSAMALGVLAGCKGGAAGGDPATPTAPPKDAMEQMKKSSEGAKNRGGGNPMSGRPTGG